MLCAPLIGPTCNEALKQILHYQDRVDIWEFRLDLFKHYTLEELSSLRKQLSCPIIFTLKKKDSTSEYEYQENLLKLAQLEPTYIDIDFETNPSFIQKLLREFPHIQFIISYHNFSCTPDDLESLLKKIQVLPAHLYKIACKAHSIIDSLRMLRLVCSHAPLLGMCMGEHGQLTRLLGTIMGAPWVYACLDEDQKTAEGQLSTDVLRNIYHISRMTTSTTVYGLIGGNVSPSLSHFTHNTVFNEQLIDAIYVKMSVEVCELPPFFELIKQLPIAGLSVTMPLKEEVLPFLDDVDPYAKKIGAVNTIKFYEGRSYGYNTDGKGALDAIEKQITVSNKKLVILGAGGASRAIIYEALKRGAQIIILNRTPHKAERLGQEFGCESGELNHIHKLTYDILINTTPDPLPIDPKGIQVGCIVMDIKTLPKMSLLLKEAAPKRCTLVFGYEMFINQAVEQFHLWLALDRQTVYDTLCSECVKHIDLRQ